jgi:hypothetical protein
MARQSFSNPLTRVCALRPLMFLIVAAALGLHSLSARAYALSFAPVAQTVALGSEASVAVRIADAMPGGLGAYDFDVTFDPSVVAFDRADDAFGLGLAFGLGTTGGVGRVTVSDFSLESIADLLALQTDSFDLFTLVFDAVGGGVSPLGFEAVTLGDAAGNPVAFTAGAGSITVTAAVPEPGSTALVAAAALALFGVGAARRRAWSV